MAPRVAALWLLLAAARAGDPQTCPAGRDCAPGEQDEAGLLQQSARFAEAKRHQHAVLVNKPNNTDECKLVPNINTALPIVYDPSCPGQCCFEDTPCRYCNEGCYGQGACSAPTPTPARLAQMDPTPAHAAAAASPGGATAMSQVRLAPDDCKCAEPGGNNNEIWQWSQIWNQEWEYGWLKIGNCPVCCQCTASAVFKCTDSPAQCFGGDQCGKC